MFWVSFFFGPKQKQKCSFFHLCNLFRVTGRLWSASSRLCIVAVYIVLSTIMGTKIKQIYLVSAIKCWILLEFTFQYWHFYLLRILWELKIYRQVTGSLLCCWYEIFRVLQYSFFMLSRKFANNNKKSYRNVHEK